MRLKLLAAIAITVFPLAADANTAFHGVFKCELRAAEKTAVFHVGAEIIVGVAVNGELKWMSDFVVGLSYDCTPSGYLLICPQDEHEGEQFVVDTRTLTMVRTFSSEAFEEWDCEPLALAFPE